MEENITSLVDGFKNRMKGLPVKILQPKTRSLYYRMIWGPLRQWVVDILKKPLMDMVILTGKRFRQNFGEITKETVTYENSRVYIDVWEKFFQYENNPMRLKFFQALRDITVAENETDFYYAFRIHFFLEEFIKAILEGRFNPRPEGIPNQCWYEPKPYGGKYSIIYKMREHREEINKILEAEDVRDNTEL